MRFILPLLVLVPVALVMGHAHTGGPTAVFLASALSLVPLAGLLGLGDGLATVLIVSHALYILFSLPQGSPETESREHGGTPTIRLPTASGLMAATTIGIIVMSELLVGAVQLVADQWGLSEMFIGVMLVLLVGTIAEHIVAVQCKSPIRTRWISASASRLGLACRSRCSSRRYSCESACSWIT